MPTSPRPAPDRSTASPGSGPRVELVDLGIWYPRRRRRLSSLRRLLLHRSWREGPEKLWALRNISLSCGEGQVVGVVGANGAGKSTLCLAIAGILPPDEGSTRVRGNVSALLSLGTGFNRDLSGRANILINAAFLGIPRQQIRSQIDDVVAFAELGSAIDEPVRTYSSGMRARLGFAVAAILEPEILILDEILSVGDIAFREKSERRIHEMIGRSKLIVIVSHSPEMVADLCTHCLWLDRGRLAGFGEARPVVREFVKAMLPPGHSP